MRKYLHRMTAFLLAGTLLFSNMGTAFASDEPPVLDSTSQAPEAIEKTEGFPAENFGSTPEIKFTITQTELNALLDAAGPTGITLDEGALSANPADAALIASGVRDAITESGDLLLEQRDVGGNCTALILARRDAGGNRIEHVAIIGVNGNADTECLVKATITGDSLYLYESTVKSWSSSPSSRAAMTSVPESRKPANSYYTGLYPLTVPPLGYTVMKAPTLAVDSPFAMMEAVLHPGIANFPLASITITAPSEPIPTGETFWYKVDTKTGATPTFFHSIYYVYHLFLKYEDIKCYLAIPHGIGLYENSKIKLVPHPSNN